MIEHETPAHVIARSRLGHRVQAPVSWAQTTQNKVHATGFAHPISPELAVAISQTRYSRSTLRSKPIHLPTPSSTTFRALPTAEDVASRAVAMYGVSGLCVAMSVMGGSAEADE